MWKTEIVPSLIVFNWIQPIVQNILHVCTAEHFDFLQGYRSSRLLGSAPEQIITYLKTLDVTYNHHRNCISSDVSTI